MPYLRLANERGLPLHLGFSALALTLALAATVARAQDADPPSRVGRISLIEGTVSLHAGANDPWAGAVVNYPVAQGSSLWTEPGGKAEIELGSARIRLDGATELDVAELDDQNIVLSVPQGRVDVSLGDHPGDEHYVIQTPRGDVELTEDGRYRLIAGTPDQATRVATFHGQALIAEPQTQVTVGRDEEAIVGPGEPPSFQIAAPGEDGFDHWASDRDRELFATNRPHYVSTDMPGGADLDRYGSWRDSAEYGHVWVPTTVAAGWAPYREGHWAFVAPWGWTWIDDAPWGFAPFHYGRWAEIDGSWAWVPGEAVVHPAYAPALVAWVGNPGVSVGIGIGAAAVAWIALGPREVWVPPYHTSVDYVRHANVTNVNRTVINNITVNNITTINNNTAFVNRKNVTVVSQQTFAGAAPVHRAMLPVNQAAAGQFHAAAAPSLPQPTPAAQLAAPGHAGKPPPQAPLAAQHPIQPIHALPSAAPNAGHAGPPPTGGLPPHPAAPTPVATPTPAAAPNAAAHPAPQATPAPNQAPHPGGPAGSAEQHAPAQPAPSPPAVPTPHPTPGSPGFHPPAMSAPQPPPQGQTPHPPQGPEPQHPATPQPQATQPPVARPVVPEHAAPAQPQAPHPAPQPQVPQPQAPHPAPQPQVTQPPAVRPVVPEHAAPAQPQAPHPTPQPQVPQPQAPHPAPPPQVTQPQVARPVVPEHTVPAQPPQAPHPPAQPQAPNPPHPQGPAPNAHPPAANPPPQGKPPEKGKEEKKDEKKPD
ncbi:MAG TPA: DUF6600 domain-containing protein [Aliidongia sp.]|nr:DUF6600 domain-containing protein [Aliidongia sp.]